MEFGLFDKRARHRAVLQKVTLNDFCWDLALYRYLNYQDFLEGGRGGCILEAEHNKRNLNLI